MVRSAQSPELRVFWDDALISATATQVVGGTYANFIGTIQMLQLRHNQSDSLHWAIQFPHQWLEGTRIGPHFHWGQIAADAGNIRMEMEYSWANAFNEFSSAVTNGITFAGSPIGPVRGLPIHQITAFPYLEFPGARVSSLMVGRVGRLGLHGDDTSTVNIFPLSIDLHIKKNQLGSEHEYRREEEDYDMEEHEG